MAHDWIKHLADQIKEVDHDAANRPVSGPSQTNLIRTKSPVFFDSTVKAIERGIVRLKEELRGDVTEGSICIKRQEMDHAVQLMRPAFPFFSAILALDCENNRIKFTYSKANPAISFSEEQIPTKDASLHFMVGCYDMIYLAEANGSKKIHTPDELARHVLETLFSV